MSKKSLERLTVQIRQRTLIETAICEGIRNMTKHSKVYDQAVSLIVALEDAGFKIVRDPHKKQGPTLYPEPCLCGDYGPHPGCVDPEHWTRVAMGNRFLPCQCEHAAHFPDEKKPTPNGNPGHLYGAKFHESYITKVKTPHGPFHVCNDCRDDCYAEFWKGGSNG